MTPDNPEQEQSRTVSLSWTAHQNATEYGIEVSKSETFSSLTHSKTVFSTSTSLENLDFSSVYFGGSCLLTVVEKGGYSEAEIFRTYTVNCKTYNVEELPVQIKDAMGSIVKTTDVNLDIYDQAIVQDLDVNLTIDHGYIGDISLYLVAPDNTRIKLAQNLGDNQNDYIDTVFDQNPLAQLFLQCPLLLVGIDPKEIYQY